MESIEIDEAKSRLEEFLDRVAEGQEFAILRDGRPVARLIPVDRQPLGHDVRETIAEMRAFRRTNFFGHDESIRECIDEGR